ncbi:uncharacterized protein PHALS_05374 [Plasmopara halstedii]|uniref:Uncharacterized protein n=1 Tax=Plasmopara halstedii TaxID=4781 RepID=A0A0N7L438_PLAHL|nr:uncharacterized protein PHALS_05374 [Plasmopara halstedii]CEG37595.1 hypothetical protein PHALS_05374 [Plasmopara halstedii]|eukprot:XP_024573964.1 hypothetical protein PHALS_05374 [Plasmopara halstedii]
MAGARRKQDAMTQSGHFAAPYTTFTQTFQDDDNHKGDENHRRPKAHVTQVPGIREDMIGGEERAPKIKPQNIEGIRAKFLASSSRSINTQTESPQTNIQWDIRAIRDALKVSQQQYSLSRLYQNISTFDGVFLHWKQLNYPPIQEDQLLDPNPSRFSVLDAALLPPGVIVKEDLDAATFLEDQKIVMHLRTSNLKDHWSDLLTNWIMRNYSRKRTQQTLQYAKVEQNDLLTILAIFDELKSTKGAEAAMTFSRVPDSQKCRIPSVITTSDVEVAKSAEKHAILDLDQSRFEAIWTKLITLWILRNISREQILQTLFRAELREESLPRVIVIQERIASPSNAGLVLIPGDSIQNQVKLASEQVEGNANLRNGELTVGLHNLLIKWGNWNIPRIQVAITLDHAGFSLEDVTQILSLYDPIRRKFGPV